MKILIRADSGSVMGSGHVMRCLVLAHRLLALGNEVIFICADLPGNICNHIVNDGVKLFKINHSSYEVFSWQDDLAKILPILENIKPDLLIVDHYQLGKEWETGTKLHAKRIMVIDDYLNRPHYCDIFLNQNFSPSEKQRLDDNLPKNCVQILGPEYAILREEFIKAERKSSPATELKNILISFGGTDSYNLTEKIVMFFIKHNEYRNIKVNCVIGWQNKNQEKIKYLCEEHKNFIYHREINYMAKLISEADLCIGAGGSSSWERLYIGVPSIIVSLADNQDSICKWLYKNKLSYYIGKAKDFSESSLKKAIDIIGSENIWQESAINLGQRTVDGSGAERIIACINSM